MRNLLRRVLIKLGLIEDPRLTREQIVELVHTALALREYMNQKAQRNIINEFLESENTDNKIEIMRYDTQK